MPGPSENQALIAFDGARVRHEASGLEERRFLSASRPSRKRHGAKPSWKQRTRCLEASRAGASSGSATPSAVRPARGRRPFMRFCDTFEPKGFRRRSRSASTAAGGKS